jgi:hypothetical protein
VSEGVREGGREGVCVCACVCACVCVSVFGQRLEVFATSCCHCRCPWPRICCVQKCIDVFMYLCRCCWLLLPSPLPFAKGRFESGVGGFVWYRVMGVGVGVVGFDLCVCARALSVRVDLRVCIFIYIDTCTWYSGTIAQTRNPKPHALT